ncbi:pyruvate dehydrogenase [acetyl-transferring]-phosphatase 2, mitochondrial isoform X2 [Alligator sinensis]|nr:pyruvate dehydrogenase [acetyl-transferring]-phosphatase 2, mitochondrial isoform X2 [Alligator sinensis]XP_006028185.1 pyruvate dehydrogenase [acetyl-transferring]-phosphatase 2, mitochondrial isoform X2 [Alligator sinensis]XP_006028186.1 pyruvate dehydrogenase [acetyl-transferring]-phosphatase 2, mitochondrial isoform X2 [Alligator sinensis]XP_014377521.1 pyruvate dehydrogenase [acetyl-transferring]-phosphatase 2, mitochondrial isoform X2 [Alligator sinensis]XP_025065248.1 pyruvate dehydro
MMSNTVSSWILSSARNSIFVLQGKGRLYSKWIPHQSKMKCKCMFAKAPLSPVVMSCSIDSVFTLKAFRHTSTEEQHFTFQLTPSQINDVLKAGELSHKISEFDGRNSNSVLRFESNQLASNAPSEDRRSAATCLQTKGMMFGIFDGHGGYACAQAVSERLFYYIAVSLMSQQALEEMELATECMKPVLPILQWYKHPNDLMFREVASLYFDHLRVYWQDLLNLDLETGFSVEEALINAFKRLDSDITLEVQAPLENEVMRNIALQVAFSGATACVSHIDGVHLHVANAGDCRAILGVQEEDGTWSALSLTQDHNVFNEAEIRRLKEEHPKVEEKTIIVNDRLLGILIPSRSFGDVQLKWSKELQQSVLENGSNVEALNIYQYVPPNYYTPPYLTAEPEVTYHKLRRKDRFLVMASDGLWDMLNNEDVVKLVAEHLAESTIQKPELKKPVNLGYMQSLLLQRKSRSMGSLDQNIATHLIRHAVGNNEYGEIDQEKLAAMLTLPEDLARMYRDDITVTVVYFNSDAIENYYQGKK